MQGIASLRRFCHVGATLGANALRFGATWVRSRTTLESAGTARRFVCGGGGDPVAGGGPGSPRPRAN